MSRIVKTLIREDGATRSIPLIPIQNFVTIQEQLEELELDQQTSVEMDIAHRLQQMEEKLAHAQAESQRMIHEAKVQADQILEEAQQKARNLLMEAKLQGVEQGLLQGRQQAKEEWEAGLAQAGRIVQSIEAERVQVLVESTEDMIELSIQIARTIMGRELIMNRGWVLSVVKDALREIHEAPKLEIRVHPDDYSVVADAKETLSTGLPGQTHVSVIPDGTIESGGCVILTPQGSVDARVDTQLRAIQESLIEWARRDRV